MLDLMVRWFMEGSSLVPRPSLLCFCHFPTKQVFVFFVDDIFAYSLHLSHSLGPHWTLYISRNS